MLKNKDVYYCTHSLHGHLASLPKSMGVFDAEDDYVDAASADGARAGRPDKRNYNLDHLARMNFRRSARNNFRDREIPRDSIEICIFEMCFWYSPVLKHPVTSVFNIFLGHSLSPTEMGFQAELSHQRAQQQTHPGRTLKVTRSGEGQCKIACIGEVAFMQFSHAEEDEEFSLIC